MSKLLKTKEVAKLLDISESTLARWRLTGGGPPWVKTGVIVRYHSGELNTWLEERRCSNG